MPKSSSPAAYGRCATSKAATARSSASKQVQGDYKLSAGRRDSHRPLPAGVRPRFDAGLSRTGHRRQPRRRGCRLGDETVTGALIAETGDVSDSEHVSRDDEHDRRSPIAAIKPAFSCPAAASDVAVPRLGQAAAKLCRLAFELASQPDIDCRGSHLALNGLFESTHVDAGAVLLLAARYERRADTPPICRSSPRGPMSSRPITALRAFWPRRCSAMAKRCWPATSKATANSAAATARANSTPPSVICAPIRQDRKVDRPDPSLFDRRPTACPIRTIWSSRWPWPTTSPWPCAISHASRSWPKT